MLDAIINYKPYVSHMYVLFVYKVKLKGSTMQKLISTTKEQERLLKIHANLFMHTNTLHLYTIHSMLYHSLVQNSREYYTGTNMYKKTYREEWKAKLHVFAVTHSVPA